MSIAKKAISQYTKATGDQTGTLELMAYFVERGDQFIVDFGDINAGFYSSLESMFGRILETSVPRGGREGRGVMGGQYRRHLPHRFLRSYGNLWRNVLRRMLALFPLASHARWRGWRSKLRLRADLRRGAAACEPAPRRPRCDVDGTGRVQR